MFSFSESMPQKHMHEFHFCIMRFSKKCTQKDRKNKVGLFFSVLAVPGIAGEHALKFSACCDIRKSSSQKKRVLPYFFQSTVSGYEFPSRIPFWNGIGFIEHQIFTVSLETCQKTTIQPSVIS